MAVRGWGGGVLDHGSSQGWAGCRCASRPPEGRRVGLFLFLPQFPPFPWVGRRAAGAALAADSWAELALQRGRQTLAGAGRQMLIITIAMQRACRSCQVYHFTWVQEAPFIQLSQETKACNLWVCNHTCGNLGTYPLKMSRPGFKMTSVRILFK